MSSANFSGYRQLAYVQRRPVEGRRTRGINASGIVQWTPGSSRQADSNRTNAPAAINSNHDNKTVDFICYDDSDEEEPRPEGDNISCNFTDCLTNRELGLDQNGFQAMRLTSEYGTRHMLSNAMLKEYPVVLQDTNKIFCSQWLSYRQVVFGTKCNRLMVYDVNNRHMDQIPSLPGSEARDRAGEEEQGIHSIEINPSRTLLATGAKNNNDVAVYRLPTLDPICVGEGAHGDCIFDMTWLDDQFLVSGARDGTLALWRVTDEMIDRVTASEIPSFLYSRPLSKKFCKSAERVRSLCYNERTREFVVISFNGYIHCWNALKFKQFMSKKLPHSIENVCLSTDEDSTMYAVGSKANTDLLDARTFQAIRKIPSRNNGCGIRSVSFKGNILTIGTGVGLLLFWDLRAGKFLESTMNSNRAVSLKTSKGWVQRDEIFLQNDAYSSQRYTPAVYTHCYDVSGTRLFAAGGPLETSVVGNYIGIFQ